MAIQNKNSKMTVGIYIYDNAEVLDFSGPYEVFSVASRFLSDDAKFDVCLISEKEKSITARGNYSVNVDYTFKNHPDLDILIVVGGIHTEELEKPTVINWIQTQASKAKLIASVCTGAFLLAKAEIITHHSVTTHWEDIDDLKKMFPSLHVKENIRWVDEGNIVTSAGISAGIDMSLHLVEKVHSLDLAKKTAKKMQFDWCQA